MKVWEETWLHSHHDVRMAPDVIGQENLFSGGLGVSSEDEASISRARLAARAPELARMLLELEWSDGNVYVPRCVLCLGAAPNHSDDCALDALLREAGVR